MRRAKTLALGLLLGLAAACGPTEVRVFDETLVASEPPPELWPLRVAGGLPARTFDPNGAEGWTEASALIHARLYALDDQGRLVPDLVRQDEETPEGLRLKLVRAFFHDGSPVRARDVVATFEALRRDDASEVGRNLALVSAMVAEDPATVMIRLSAPFPELREALTEMAVLPASRLDGASREKAALPIGAGPYVLVQSGRRGLVFRPHERWHGGPAGVEWILLKIIPDVARRAEALADGAVDLAVLQAVDPGPFRDPERFTTHVARSGVLRALVLDTRDEALREPAVRRALSLLVDRRRIVTDVLQGLGRPAWQYLPDISPAHDPRIVPPRNPRAAAERELRSAGYERGIDGRWVRDGKPLRIRLLAWKDDAFRRLAVARIVQDYREFGIAAETVLVTHDEYRRAARNLETFGEGFLGGWSMHLAPALVLARKFTSGGSQNHAGFNDARVDAVLREALSEEQPDRRVRLVREAQRRILELSPWIPVAFVDQMIVARRGVQGFETPFLDSWYEYPRFLHRARLPEEQ